MEISGEEGIMCPLLQKCLAWKRTAVQRERTGWAGPGSIGSTKQLTLVESTPHSSRSNAPPKSNGY